MWKLLCSYFKAIWLWLRWSTVTSSHLLPEVDGQHCPCLVFFGFSGKSCPVSVCCPDSVRIFYPVSVCPDSVWLDSVRSFLKNPVRCISVRIFPVSILSAVRIIEKKLSVVWLSGQTRMRQSCPEFHFLSADVWSNGTIATVRNENGTVLFSTYAA